MTLANATAVAGEAVATHTASGKEHQVVIEAAEDGHIKGTRDAYVASYKLATDTAVSALSVTHTANQERQYATIFHTASATKLVKVRRVELYIAATAASVVNFELRYLNGTTAPATGNPAVTPRRVHPAAPAAEATCLAAPTTAGSFPAAEPFLTQEMNLGANTAQTTAFPSDPLVMWPAEGDGMDEISDLVMRAGVAEGYAISVRTVAAVTLKATARIIFTEHTP